MVEHTSGTVPLSTLVREANNRHLERYAQVIGKPLEIARESFRIHGNSPDVQQELELLEDELKVMPIYHAIRRLIPEGPVSISTQGLKEYGGSLRLNMDVDRLILALGRAFQREKKRQKFGY